MAIALTPAQIRFQQIKRAEKIEATRNGHIAQKILNKNPDIDASLLARIVTWRKSRGLD